MDTFRQILLNKCVHVDQLCIPPSKHLHSTINTSWLLIRKNEAADWFLKSHWPLALTHPRYHVIKIIICKCDLFMFGLTVNLAYVTHNEDVQCNDVRELPLALFSDCACVTCWWWARWGWPVSTRSCGSVGLWAVTSPAESFVTE